MTSSGLVWPMNNEKAGSGLCHKVIAQSGAGHSVVPIDDARIASAELAARLGVPPTADGFAGVDVGTLIATQQAVAKAEGSAKSVRDGAAEVSRQALAYVEENVAASFDFAHRLVQARTIEEIAALQKEFIARQMASLTEQGKSLGDMMGRAASGAMDKARK